MGKLSALAVKNLKEPGRYSDGEGLILKLAAQGRGSWVLRVQADGKRRDIGLGSLADVGLADARESARAIRKQMKSGVDVVAERKKNYGDRCNIQNYGDRCNIPVIDAARSDG